MSGSWMLNAVVVAAVCGAVIAWLVAARAFFGIWQARGEVSRLELAGSFLTAVRKLPPMAAPQLKRLAVAGSIFFACVFVGLAAGSFVQR